MRGRRWLQVGGRPPPGQGINSRGLNREKGGKNQRSINSSTGNQEKGLISGRALSGLGSGHGGTESLCRELSGLSNQVALSGWVVLAISKLGQNSHGITSSGIASSVAESEISEQFSLLDITEVIVGLPLITSSRNFAFWLRLTQATGKEAEVLLQDFQRADACESVSGKGAFFKTWNLKIIEMVKSLPSLWDAFDANHIARMARAGILDIKGKVVNSPHSVCF